MRLKKILLVFCVFVLASELSGCVYLVNRKNDAMDMFDLGILVSKKPGLAIYMNKPPVMPIGFSHVDGKLIGLAKSNFGVFDFREKSFGYLIGGSEQRGVGNYDPQNPQDPKRYGAGAIGFLSHTTTFQNDPGKDETVARPRTQPTCPMTLHLGWIGFEWGCKFWSMIDFVVGWTGIDIAHDDQPGFFTKSTFTPTEMNKKAESSEVAGKAKVK
jgi:hypothetical protein